VIEYEQKRKEIMDHNNLVIQQVNTLKSQKNNAEESYRNCDSRKKKELEPILEKLHAEETTYEGLMEISKELKIKADKSIFGKKAKMIQYTETTGLFPKTFLKEVPFSSRLVLENIEDC